MTVKRVSVFFWGFVGFLSGVVFFFVTSLVDARGLLCLFNRSFEVVCVFFHVVAHLCPVHLVVFWVGFFGRVFGLRLTVGVLSYVMEFGYFLVFFCLFFFFLWGLVACWCVFR